MLSRYLLLLVTLAFPTFGCNNVTHQVVNEKVMLPDTAALRNRIISIAQRLVEERKGTEHIWNLSEIDTTQFTVFEDYFLGREKTNKMVLFEGEAGLSAGSAHNLLIVFSDTLNVVWAEQTGDIKSGDIGDFNNDGVKEIVFENSTMWMGECADIYEIINFKNNKRSVLYNATSRSVIDCGGIELGTRHTTGDTLETNFSCRIVKCRNSPT